MVKLKDIAAAAGVSEMTVSRALRNRGEVASETRRRIEEVAARLGYVPNRIAGALASRSVSLVAVVAPSLKSQVFPEVLSGVSAALAESDLQPVIGVSTYDLAEEERVVRTMLAWRPAGFIIAGLEHTDATRALLSAAGIPVVEIMDVDGEPIRHCVGVSHREAGRRMAKAMLARGHRRIGFIGTKMPSDFRARKRLDGFEAALGEAGVTLADRELYAGGSTVATGRELTATLLARRPDIDCLYYSSDVLAVGGLMHALAAGLRVPEEIALAGFNGLDMLDGLPVRLATTNAYRFEIGREAAAIVLDALAGRGPEGPRVVRFEPEAEPGESLREVAGAQAPG